MNRKISLLLMAVMMAASVFIGSWRVLSGLENRLENAFVSGVEGDGFSIQKDLDTVYQKSHEIMTVAQRYLGEDNGLISAVAADRELLNRASSPAEKYTACQELLESVKSLYYSVLAPSEKDETLLKMAYTDITSAADTMKLDGYNSLVLEYNSTLSGFPVGLIGGLLGFERAELFG